MDDSDTIPFLTRLGAKPSHPPPDDQDEVVALGNAYAVAGGGRTASSLRFLFRNGKTLAMPYGYLPIIWGESPGLILLEYPNFFAMILAGKELGLLETRLCANHVTWIRECDPAQAALLPTAVTRIARMKRYPSREFDDG